MKVKKKCSCKAGCELKQLKQANHQASELYHDLQKSLKQVMAQPTAELSTSIQNFQAMTIEARQASLKAALVNLESRVAVNLNN